MLQLLTAKNQGPTRHQTVDVVAVTNSNSRNRRGHQESAKRDESSWLSRITTGEQLCEGWYYEQHKLREANQKRHESDYKKIKAASNVWEIEIIRGEESPKQPTRNWIKKKDQRIRESLKDASKCLFHNDIIFHRLQNRWSTGQTLTRIEEPEIWVFRIQLTWEISPHLCISSATPNESTKGADTSWQ